MGALNLGVTTGSYNTIIGAQISGLSASLSNTIILADGQGNIREFIDNTGRVGIGNTAPALALHVGSSSVTNSTNLLRLEDTNSTCDFNADTGAPSCGSDITLKKNVNDLSGNLDKVLALRPVTYNWLTDSDGATIQHGFIAQEVETIMPELVHDGTWIDGTTRKFLQTAGMTPYIVGAIKELDNNLQELDLKITPLTSLDTTNTNSLGSLIKTFLADSANTLQILFVGEVHTKKLCLDDVCVTKDQLEQILQNNSMNGNSSSGTSGGTSGSTSGAENPTTGGTSGDATTAGTNGTSGDTTSGATGDTTTSGDSTTTTGGASGGDTTTTGTTDGGDTSGGIQIEQVM